MGEFDMAEGEPGPVGSPSARIIPLGRRVRPLIVLAVILAIFALPQLLGRAAAQTNDARLRSGNVDLLTSVTLVQHKSRNLRLDVPFAVVEVADPDIADARAISDRQLFILGKKIGATNVLLYSASRQLIGVVDVEVKLDTRSLGSKIREGSGGKGIRVNDVYGKLVLSGNGGDSQTVERAMSVAAGLAPAGVVNALKVTTSQQVMLKVRFVEATRTAARNLGVRWEFFKRSGNLAGVVGTQTGTSKFFVNKTPFVVNANGNGSVLDVVGGAAGVGSPFATIITQIVNNSSAKLDVVLSALEEQNVIRKLAEPNLIAMSGETADFLAGGEFPVPIVSPGNGGLSTVTITYKEFGVKLSFTPTVLARGVISLKLVPEVSELDFANAVTISGSVIPSLTTRRARTTVELRDGQSFAIAGLLQADSARNQDQLPWLGSVPVLGALFRSAAYQANETELVVLVTPYLIKPVPPGKKLKTPLDSSLAGNDLDYFLNGQPEVPKTPPFAPNPFGGVQSLFGGIEPGPPIPASVPVAVVAPVSEPIPEPQGNGALHYDPATGYFTDPPAHGGGQ
ncbi:MAG: type II and III secretion system protein family protein [Pseudomonadota bacterium]|nr:type II and III secretion system protein family protein [Pseudomonadota bacterium]